MKPGDLIEVSKQGHNINVAFCEDENFTSGYASFFHDKSDILMICRQSKRPGGGYNDVMFTLLTKFGIMYASKRYIECYTQKVK